MRLFAFAVDRKHFSRRSVFQTFHDLSLQFRFEYADTRTRNLRDVAALGNVTTHDLVAVLVRAFFVRTPREAEENPDVELLLKSFVMNEQNVVVERERVKLGESFLDTAECTFHCTYGHRMYLLEERPTKLSVGHVEHDAGAAFTRDEEVALAISDADSFVDIQGSFRDHALAVESRFPPPAAPSSAEHIRAVRFNASPVRTLDVSSDEASRYRLEVFVVSLDPLRNMFGRLIVHEIAFDDFLEFGIKRDHASLCAGILAPRVRSPIRIRRAVRSVFSREVLQFVPHRALHDTDSFRDLLQGVSLLPQYLNLVTSSSRQMRTFFLFSFAHSTKEIQIQKSICPGMIARGREGLGQAHTDLCLAIP